MPIPKETKKRVYASHADVHGETEKLERQADGHKQKTGRQCN